VMFILAPAILGMPILFGTLIQFGMSEEYTGLTAAVRRSGPAHPRIMALSGELDVGHPLVRRVDGVWVGQSHSLWLMLSAQLLIDSKRGDRQMLAEYVERDARTFAANVRDNKPDIILVGAGERVLQMSANPHIAAAMATYAPGETASGVTIWMRKPL
jgi:hypothetical protein